MLIISRLILLVSLLLAVSSDCPKIIWAYWDQGIDKYAVAKMFDEHHRLVAKGWDVRMLDRNTYQKYLAEIPYYAGDIDTMIFRGVQHKSDYIRILLMSYYGGVWIDQSTIFVEDLFWLQFYSGAFIFDTDFLNCFSIF